MPCELDASITKARRSFSQRRKRVIKVRKADLKQQIYSILEERLSKKMASEQRASDEREKLFCSLQDLGGLWTSKDEIEGGLAKVTGRSKKLQALKKQISARQKLLKQCVDETLKYLFAFSKNKVAFTFDTLRQNLEKLVDVSKSRSTNDEPHAHGESKAELRTQIRLTPNCLVGKLIEHCWSEDGNDEWWQGKVLSVETVSSKGVIYQVTYWQKDSDNPDDADEEAYDVALEEILADIQEGNLDILNM